MTLESGKRIGPLSDWDLYKAFTLLFFFYFALSAYSKQTELNTVLIFGLGWLGSLVLIRDFSSAHGESADIGGRPDYDDNLDLAKLVEILIGIAVLFVVTTIFGKLKAGILFIPQPPPSMFALSTTVTQATHQTLWQIFSVSPSEEGLRLSLSLFLIKRLESLSGDMTLIGLRLNEVIGAGFPAIAWGLLHGQLAYGGDVISVLAAITAGIILYVFLQMSNSVLVPIAIHGSYNLVVLAMTGAI